MTASSAPGSSAPGRSAQNRPVQIRAMEPEDLPAVLAIESESQPNPWTEKIFIEELAREWARLMVAVQAGTDGTPEVVAFCNYWLVADELQLLNICCSIAHRRQGHANLLMQHMLDVAKGRSCRLITLEVRVSNAGAIALYERYEFASAGVRPGYYSDNQEDAKVMLLHLDSSE